MRHRLSVSLTSKRMDKEKSENLQQSIDWDQLDLQDVLFAMEEVPQPPSVGIFMSALVKCKQERNLTHTMCLLTYMHEWGLETHETLGHYLVELLMEFGSTCEAQKVFMRLFSHDEYSWNSLITGFVKHGSPNHALTLYQRMQEDSVHPSGYTFVILLKACANLKNVTAGLELHDGIARIGLQRDLFVGSSLVDMYAKCGFLSKAQEVFDNLREKDTVSWNALIAGYCKQGLFDKAINCYEQLQKQNIVPSNVTFVSLLKACSGLEDIDMGQKLHIEIAGKGLLERDSDIRNELIEMYSSCGFFTEAEEVCDKLSSRDTQSWTALVSGYCKHRCFLESLSCYEQMQLEGITPGVVIYLNVLKALSSLTATDMGQEIHAEIAKKGFLDNNLVGTALVDMYSNCGLVAESQEVFDNLPVRDIISWTALITGYLRVGRVKEAATCFNQMKEEDVLPDAMAWNALIEGFVKHRHDKEALDCLQQMGSKGICPDILTFVFSLKACGTIRAIGTGRDLHIDITKKGLLESYVVVGNALVDFYATSGLLAEGQHAFNELPVQDVVSWTSLMAGYTKYGLGHEALNLLEQMQLLGVPPNTATFVCSLKACGTALATKKGQEMHDEIEKRGFVDLGIVRNALVDMYANCGFLLEAEELFNKLPSKDTISWTALIAGYAKHGVIERAVSCFEQMKAEGVIPDLVSWSALIAGYAMHNCGEEALICLEEMRRAGVSPDGVTCACSLKACGAVRALQKGQEIHTEITKKEFLERDVVVGNSLIDMYGTCGLLVEAQDVFDKLVVQDAVAWTSLILVYFKHGFGEEALNCFSKMQMAGFSPDAVTFICILKACSIVGAIDKGQELHRSIIRNGSLEEDVHVGNALLDMYIDCGLLAKAHEVFDKLPVKDAISWNSLIAGYAKYGCNEEALGCFEKMQLTCDSVDAFSWNARVAGFSHQEDAGNVFCALYRRGENMDRSVDAFTSVLTACSHAGLVDVGQSYFWTMNKDSTFIPTIEHHVCVVDLLGRAGQLRNAVDVIEQMPYHPHLVTLHTILGACRKWCDVDIGRQTFEYALSLNDRDASTYVCMSNIYADADMQEDAEKVDESRVINQAWQVAKHHWFIPG